MYKIGKPHRVDRGFGRSDVFIPTGEADHTIVASITDVTPVYRGQYDSKCSCCWLNFGHSEALHNWSVANHGI